jgi:hypothetical protein
MAATSVNTAAEDPSVSGSRPRVLMRSDFDQTRHPDAGRQAGDRSRGEPRDTSHHEPRDASDGCAHSEANTDFRPATMDRVGGDAVQPDRRQEQREGAEIPGDHRQQTIADVYGRSVSVTV